MPGRDLPDLDQRLRSLPAVLAVDAPAGLAERIAHRGRRRRWLRRATAAAAVLVLLGGVAVTRSVLVNQPAPCSTPACWSRRDPGSARRRPVAGPAAHAGQRAGPPDEPGGGLDRPAADRLGRGHKQVVPVPHRRGRLRPGDPALDTAPARPRGPVAGAGAGNGGLDRPGDAGLGWRIAFTDPAAGGNVVGRPSSGVAYDPARRSWRQLPALPEELRSLRSDHWTAWTGRELLVGGVREAEAGGVTVAGYDPAANRWRRLPQSPGLTGGPGHLQARTAIWSGNRLLVWSFWSDTAGAADDLTEPLPRPDAEPDGIDLWAYDPAGDRWTVLPAPTPRSARQPPRRR